MRHFGHVQPIRMQQLECVTLGTANPLFLESKKNKKSEIRKMFLKKNLNKNHEMFFFSRQIHFQNHNKNTASESLHYLFF